VADVVRGEGPGLAIAAGRKTRRRAESNIIIDEIWTISEV
jgi:hypothetical protein